MIVWPSGRSSKRARRLVWSAWGIALFVTCAGFAVEGIYAAAFPFSKVFDPTVLADTLHGRFGETAVARALLLVAAFPLLAALFDRSKGKGERAALVRWWRPAALVVGLATVLTITLASHGTTGRWTGLAVPADLLHFSAVSLWLGGLVVLLAATLFEATDAELDEVVPRYSTCAFGAVIAIVASGFFQAERQVGTVHALVSTTYGRFLLAKLVAFGVLILFAAYSREVVNGWYVPRRDARRRTRDTLHVQDRGTGRVATLDPPLAADEPAGSRARRRLIVTVAAEAVIAVVVLTLTAFLVDARPAYEVTNGPQDVTFASPASEPPAVSVNLVVQPAKHGPNQVHLTTETLDGRVANPLQVTMEVTNQDRNVGPLQVHLVRLAPGHYIAYVFELPFAGTWQVTIRALMTPFDEAVATHDITIR